LKNYIPELKSGN